MIIYSVFIIIFKTKISIKSSFSLSICLYKTKLGSLTILAPGCSFKNILNEIFDG